MDVPQETSSWTFTSLSDSGLLDVSAPVPNTSALPDRVQALFDKLQGDLSLDEEIESNGEDDTIPIAAPSASGQDFTPNQVSVGAKKVEDVADVNQFAQTRADNILQTRIGNVRPMDVQVLDLEKLGIEALPNLDILPHLDELSVNGNRLTRIGGLPSSLAELRCDQNLLESVPSLVGTALRVLHIENNRLTSLDGVAAAPRLEILRAGGNKLVKIGDSLRGLKYLQELHLQNNSLDSLLGLGALQSLQVLKLFNNRLTTLAGIEGLDQLIEVYAGENMISALGLTAVSSGVRLLVLCKNNLQSLVGMDRMPNVEDLNVDSNQLTNLDGLATVGRLRRLSAQHNVLGTKSEATLPQSMEELILTHNQIADISPYARLPLIRTLHVDYNIVTELNFNGSPSLKVLNVNNNIIAVILAEQGNQGLESLLLANNKLTDAIALGEAVKHIPLRHLDLRGNPCNNDLYPDVRGSQARCPPLQVYADLEAYDTEFRGALDDRAYMLRLHYRGSLIKNLSRLQLLDHINVSDGERELSRTVDAKATLGLYLRADLESLDEQTEQPKPFLPPVEQDFVSFPRLHLRTPSPTIERTEDVFSAARLLERAAPERVSPPVQYAGQYDTERGRTPGIDTTEPLRRDELEAPFVGNPTSQYGASFPGVLPPPVTEAVTTSGFGSTKRDTARANPGTNGSVKRSSEERLAASINETTGVLQVARTVAERQQQRINELHASISAQYRDQMARYHSALEAVEPRVATAESLLRNLQPDSLAEQQATMRPNEGDSIALAAHTATSAGASKVDGQSLATELRAVNDVQLIRSVPRSTPKQLRDMYYEALKRREQSGFDSSTTAGRRNLYNMIFADTVPSQYETELKQTREDRAAQEIGAFHAAARPAQDDINMHQLAELARVKSASLSLAALRYMTEGVPMAIAEPPPPSRTSVPLSDVLAIARQQSLGSDLTTSAKPLPIISSPVKNDPQMQMSSQAPASTAQPSESTSRDSVAFWVDVERPLAVDRGAPDRKAMAPHSRASKPTDRARERRSTTQLRSGERRRSDRDFAAIHAAKSHTRTKSVPRGNETLVRHRLSRPSSKNDEAAGNSRKPSREGGARGNQRRALREPHHISGASSTNNDSPMDTARRQLAAFSVVPTTNSTVTETGKQLSDLPRTHAEFQACSTLIQAEGGRTANRFECTRVLKIYDPLAPPLDPTCHILFHGASPAELSDITVRGFDAGVAATNGYTFHRSLAQAVAPYLLQVPQGRATWRVLVATVSLQKCANGDWSGRDLEDAQRRAAVVSEAHRLHFATVHFPADDAFLALDSDLCHPIFLVEYTFDA